MLGLVHSAWVRAAAAATAMVVATAPGLSSAAMTKQLSAGAAGGAASLSAEQTGPRDTLITNRGETAVPFPGQKLRGLARALKLDPSSTCLAATTLAPGASCGLRLRAGGQQSALVSVRLDRGADGTLALLNTGTAPLRLAGISSSPALRLGARDGGCATARTLAPGASCALPGARAAQPIAWGASSPLAATTPQWQTVEQWWSSLFTALLQGWAWIGLICVLDPYACMFRLG